MSEFGIIPDPNIKKFPKNSSGAMLAQRCHGRHAFSIVAAVPPVSVIFAAVSLITNPFSFAEFKSLPTTEIHVVKGKPALDQANVPPARDLTFENPALRKTLAAILAR